MSGRHRPRARPQAGRDDGAMPEPSPLPPPVPSGPPVPPVLDVLPVPPVLDVLPEQDGLRALHGADAAAATGLGGVVSAYVNDARWWQNASFALPLLVAMIAITGGLILHSAEALGFGIFAAIVTLVMVPVVLLTWRGTATAIVLTRGGATALHRGRVLHALEWRELRRIERVEYLGNTRYKLVHGDEDRFLTVESEIEGAAELVEAAFTLSGLPRQQPGGTHAHGA